MMMYDPYTMMNSKGPILVDNNTMMMGGAAPAAISSTAMGIGGAAGAVGAVGSPNPGVGVNGIGPRKKSSSSSMSSRWLPFSSINMNLLVGALVAFAFVTIILLIVLLCLYNAIAQVDNNNNKKTTPIR